MRRLLRPGIITVTATMAALVLVVQWQTIKVLAPLGGFLFTAEGVTALLGSRGGWEISAVHRAESGGLFSLSAPGWEDIVGSGVRLIWIPWWCIVPAWVIVAWA